MSHFRKVCPHAVLISTCRCASQHKVTEVVWPCPLPEKHAGYAVVHRVGPLDAPAGEAYPADPLGPTAVKLCVFRSCDWTTPEVNSLLELPAQNQTFRAHLRTHRIEIELLAEAIGERG